MQFAQPNAQTVHGEIFPGMHKASAHSSPGMGCQFLEHVLLKTASAFKKKKKIAKAVLCSAIDIEAFTGLSSNSVFELVKAFPFQISTLITRFSVGMQQVTVAMQCSSLTKQTRISVEMCLKGLPKNRTVSPACLMPPAQYQR